MSTSLSDLNERASMVFRQLVETYLATGAPVGSRTLAKTGARSGTLELSPASIRNVLADLEELGLLEAPHISAGRLPTQHGLRLFVDGMLELGALNEEDRANLDQSLAGGAPDGSRDDVLTQASTALSGLAQCASLVLAPKEDQPVKHLEFVLLEPGQALAILVGQNGSVENRVMPVPLGLTPSALQQASNYLNTRLNGLSLPEASQAIEADLATQKAELDALAQKVVAAGLAVWAGPDDQKDRLVVRGRANLLADTPANEDLERIRKLFDDLESKADLVKLLEVAQSGEGVKIFIGSETQLFSLSGSSLIAAPYMNDADKIVGVVGVIGPTRLNYARVIPMVDYTARLLSRSLTS